VVALDFSGMGLGGNVSEGRWPFLEDLPYLLYLSIIDNPSLVGSFPATMSMSLKQIAASGTGASSHGGWVSLAPRRLRQADGTNLVSFGSHRVMLGTGMQHKRLNAYLPLDAYVRHRSAIVSTVTGRRSAVVVASSGPDFTRPERIGFQLLTDNEPAPQYDFKPLSIPFWPRRAHGQMSAGYRYGEVQPWWFQDDGVAFDVNMGAHLFGTSAGSAHAMYLY
jgi:hypothetical protein